MACHEIAALRLGLMNVLGIVDPAERSHELEEMGPAAQTPGPLQALSLAQNLAHLQSSYETAVTLLEEKLSNTPAIDPKLGYYRTLVVLTKKVELELERQVQNLGQLYRELEEMHDFVHEIYPAE
jgi:hypothetical protein